MKFSIIVPVYNVEKYLGECLDSLIHQTYNNIEIIAVNDGSTDSSFLILEEYAKKDSRIIVINQENQGLSEARNSGLRIAQGDYVMFVDSDDYISIYTCERVYEFINQNGRMDIVTFSIQRFFNNDESTNTIIDTSGKNVPVYGKYDFLEKTILANEFDPSVCNKAFRKELLGTEQIRFIKGIYYEDLYFSFKSILLSAKIGVITDILYFYRKNRNESITNMLKEGDRDVLITVDKLEEFVSQISPQLLNDFFYNKYIYRWVSISVCYKYLSRFFYSISAHKIVRDIIESPQFKKYIKFIIHSKEATLKYKIPAWLSLNSYPLFALFVYSYFKLKKIIQ